MTESNFHCANCDAELKFSPDAHALTCPFCGTEVPIESENTKEVEELDFETYRKKASATIESIDILTVTCDNCRAELTFDPNVTSDQCPFCANAIHAQAQSKKAIKPRSLLPFSVSATDAQMAFAAWVKSRWFAPRRLKHDARIGKMSGVYMPYWTYDAHTTSAYTGKRGEHYYTTEHYTVTVNGKTEHRTRQVKHTRWYPASGTVLSNFDDILVLGTTSLPQNFAEKLEPWDLTHLVPHSEDYLQGFRAQSYGVGLEEGFDDAREKMRPVIRKDICADIGGDEQVIHSINTTYNDVTFKHILLPIWINAYRFNQKHYQILVNARTGEVQGERPWSIVKITLFVLSILAVAGGIGYYFWQ